MRRRPFLIALPIVAIAAGVAIAWLVRPSPSRPPARKVPVPHATIAIAPRDEPSPAPPGPGPTPYSATRVPHRSSPRLPLPRAAPEPQATDAVTVTTVNSW